jgi:uncharacterized membrane protein
MVHMGTVETGMRPQGDGGATWQRASTPSRGPAIRSPGTPREAPHKAEKGPNEQLAGFLGWFSIGLGLSQVLAPRAMSRLVGIDDDTGNAALMRALGIRELTSGIGILSQQHPTGWVWSRVAGDMMDLAMLGRAMSSSENSRGRTAFATAAVLGVTALDVLAGQQLKQSPNTAVFPKEGPGIHVRKSITVGRSPEEVYSFWHDFENLPRFMRHLESVRVTGAGRSHWTAKAPAGQSVEWDAVTLEDVPNELIAWRSEGDSDVYNEGAVRFRPAPGNRGTEVHVELVYEPPGGIVTSKLAKLFREEPGQQVKDDLLHFKQVMEVGEVVLSDATLSKGPHPARPDR